MPVSKRHDLSARIELSIGMISAVLATDKLPSAPLRVPAASIKQAWTSLMISAVPSAFTTEASWPMISSSARRIEVATSIIEIFLAHP
jgi:hypothetical protein